MPCRTLGRTLRCGIFLVLPIRARSLAVPTTVTANAITTTLPAAWTAYSSALVLYPLETKVATAAVLAVGGDAIAQRRGGGEYDMSRASSFVLFDAAYRGGFQHAAFPWIIEHCSGEVLGGLLPSYASSMLDPSFVAAMECTAFNQLLVVPIVYYPLFFSITGAVQGLSASESWRRARSSFVDLTIRNWKFWIPAQLVQFALLPIDLQVPYTCVMGLVWNVILSAAAGAARSAAVEAPEDVPPVAPTMDTAEQMLADAADAGKAAGAATGAATTTLQGNVVPTKLAAPVAQAKKKPVLREKKEL